MLKRKNAMNSFNTNSCSKCLFPKLKNWNELTSEQKMLAERLPASAEYTEAERKKHRFCERCWFEECRFENNTA